MWVYNLCLWGDHGLYSFSSFCSFVGRSFAILLRSCVCRSSRPCGSSTAVCDVGTRLRCWWWLRFFLLVEGESHYLTLQGGSRRLELVVAWHQSLLFLLSDSINHVFWTPLIWTLRYCNEWLHDYVFVMRARTNALSNFHCIFCCVTIRFLLYISYQCVLYLSVGCREYPHSVVVNTDTCSTPMHNWWARPV